MGDLLELAARVEALTGPDREVDGEIDRLFNQRPKHGDYDEGERAFWKISDGYSGLLVRPDGFARGSFCAGHYTASLDAAMTLVPEGHYVQMAFGADYEPWATVSDPDINDGNEVILHLASAKSPAIALCAAALRARTQSSTQQESEL